jgi:hypothetical protein
MADPVQLTDLDVITRYSIAVRAATADRDELLATLRADLAWLERGRPRSAPSFAVREYEEPAYDDEVEIEEAAEPEPEVRRPPIRRMALPQTGRTTTKRTPAKKTASRTTAKKTAAKKTTRRSR